MARKHRGEWIERAQKKHKCRLPISWWWDSHHEGDKWRCLECARAWEWRWVGGGFAWRPLIEAERI